MSSPLDRRITVYVNGHPRRLFLGLRVRHALGYRLTRQIERGEALLVDRWGNRVDLDGALYDGEQFCVRPAKQASLSRPASSGPDAEPRKDNFQDKDET